MHMHFYKIIIIGQLTTTFLFVSSKILFRHSTEQSCALRVVKRRNLANSFRKAKTKKEKMY